MIARVADAARRLADTALTCIAVAFFVAVLAAGCIVLGLLTPSLLLFVLVMTFAWFGD